MNDEFYIRKAIEQAIKAQEEGEIPVGALLVKDNEIVASNHNRTIQLNNPLAHAEKLILDSVEEKFLYDYTLYITLEPCIMCSGMIILRRVGRVVFGAFDLKGGACGSVYNVLLDKRINHTPKLTSGLLKDECSQILTEFFASKRRKK